MFNQAIEDEEVRIFLQDEAMKLQDMGIAVSGISGRFPKADNVNEYEESLFNGVDMVNDNDSSRYECGLWNLPKRAGRIKDLTKFDNEFFNISVDRANQTDHQVRIMYEVVYEAILDAGLNPANLRGSNTGVFFGTHCNEFDLCFLSHPYAAPVCYPVQHASLTAQYFDLKGMTVSYDTACASSLTAMSSAVDAIAEGLIDQAIVGCSNIGVNPSVNKAFFELKMLSPTGCVRYLDAKADGYPKSEACVAIFIQRKSSALRNYCSLMSVRTNSDGHKVEGITYPSVEGQESLIRRANQAAGISTNHVEYIEAHGTGTVAGDPIESEAISNVYFDTDESGEVCERKIGPLIVGSCKTNMGHTEGASGLCSLTKVALMFQNEIMYKSLHYESPNQNIKSLIEGKLKPVLKNCKLRGKIIPLTNYGFGGSNVHAIVRSSERPAIKFGEHLSAWCRFEPRLIVMFGRSETHVNTFFDAMLDEQSRNTRNCLTDDFLALLDNLSRDKIDRLMNYRGFMVIDRSSASVKRELYRDIRYCKLQSAPNGGQNNASNHYQECKPRVCNLIFPGLGCEWHGMAAGLIQYKPFWSTIRRLSHYLVEYKAQIDLTRLLTKGEVLQYKICNIFVSIVAYQLALTNIVKDQLQVNYLGSIVGHSIGEVACAYSAGLISEREAILVAYQLGKALDDNSNQISGKMIALNVNEQEAVNMLTGYKTLCVSCVNGPNSVTISGSIEEVGKFCVSLSGKNEINIVELNSCSIVVHNQLIMGEGIRKILQQSVAEVLKPKTERKESSSINWYSSVCSSSGWHKSCQASAEYFAECLCNKVDFYSPSRRLEDDSIVLELGPSAIFGTQLLSVPCSEPSNNDQKFHHVKLMSRSILENSQVLHIIRGIGELYLLGATFSKLTSFHSNHTQQQNGENNSILPVKRQTPSISSLFKWKHERNFFVPRYPIQFSRSYTRAKITVDILNEHDMYKADHQIEGRVLFPATGYLLLVWTYFCQAKKNQDFLFGNTTFLPVEFHRVNLYRALMLSAENTPVLDLSIQATGQFEIIESGSVLVNGYIRFPNENASGLKYGHLKELISRENLAADEVKSGDVYKKLGICGYDYGENFRNIISSSADGRHARIKYNSHFDCFTDSMLQTLILSMNHNIPTNVLFLPTAFDYIRFQPDLVMKKLAQTGTNFDKMSFSADSDNNQSRAIDEATKQATDECVFEVYCDPLTGVIITDGIEMRGVKTTLTTRRTDNQQAQLESYQFVKDIEDPIQDENMETLYEKSIVYAKICNSMAARLLGKMFDKKCSQVKGLDYEVDKHLHAVIQNADLFESRYLKKYLNSVDKVTETKQAFDPTLNEDGQLMFILDKLIKEGITNENTEILMKSYSHLKHDLIQSAFVNERLVRSLLEIVAENACMTKSTLNALEFNGDGVRMSEALTNILYTINRSLSVDYLLSHQNIEEAKQTRVSLNDDELRLCELQSLLKNDKLKNQDLIIYKDLSCSFVLNKENETMKAREILRCLSKFVTDGGFVMVGMRQELTLAERSVMLLYYSTNYIVEDDVVDRNTKHDLMLAELGEMNKQLRTRCDTFVSEAEQTNLAFVSKKSESNGCTWLLFRRRCEQIAIDKEHNYASSRPIMIRVTHEDKDNISLWLEALKANFAHAQVNEVQQAVEEKVGSRENNKLMPNVWLCAAESRQHQVSGLIGMMQALRKELGSQRLRCFYDSYTFKHCDEPVSVQQIAQSDKFRFALKRDLIWNCVDSDGNFGSFRHFTISNYFNYDECLCANTIVDKETHDQAAGEDIDYQKCGYVNYAIRGDLSSFTWFEAPMKILTDNERENICTVAYSALNFKDIMLATGRLSLDAIPLELAIQDCVIGFEFSGLNSNNKRVMGMVSSRAIATHVLCPRQASFVIEVPDCMSLAEAATIPVVYATAIMALIYRGKMKRGESILIHAGSGGVGQAAIRLAAHYGLTIYTTVGSSEKRKFLLQEFPDCLSDERIFSSRDCIFEDRIMEMTDGIGVDLVLNSLADEKLQASVRCLADGGRFLEIGKYDMSINTQLELNKLDTNKTFHGISLDKLFDTNEMTHSFKQQIDCVSSALSEGLKQGYIKPIKHMIFQKNQIEEAFRYMATGKHIGKVLIEINASLEFQTRIPTFHRLQKIVPRFQVSKEKSYIVTGGLGGFGLELVKWLVQEGACNIVITSRSGITTSYQASTVERLSSNGKARLLIVDKQAADTTCLEGVEKLCEMALDMTPKRQIGGVFHLAMVLKDSLLENMTADDFELVLRPKVNTFVHLDQVTRERNLNLDYFVAFSSVTSGKGNVGQANYAYANSCLERICERRKSMGLHGLAIQWGAIGDVGVAFENFGGNDIIIDGTIAQRIPSCMSTLSKLLCSPFATCLSVVPTNKSIDLTEMNLDSVSAILNILGFKDQSKIKEGATLGELGLDSLMAIEIRQYIQREYAISLSFEETRALTVENIRQLADDNKMTKKCSSTQDRVVSINNQKSVKSVENYGKNTNTSTISLDYTSCVSRSYANIIPLIKLPREKFVYLNDVSCDGQRPIFFIPPIHGHFKELEKVCSAISRPCVGINWTSAYSAIQTIDDVVDVYIDVLANTDWKAELKYDFTLNDLDKRVVDLVGYSIGATIAFELMLALEKSSVDVETDRKSKPLKPGRLVLIDGSPKQTELASMFLKNMTKDKPLSLEQKVDESLLIYINSHATNYNVTVDGESLRADLSACKLETKSLLCSERLFNALKQNNLFLANFNVMKDGISDSWDSEMDKKSLIEIAEAMEAFWRKFTMVESYRATRTRLLITDCALITADQPFLVTPADFPQELGDDLGINDFVQDKISAFKLKGDHLNFTEDNYDQISEIIENHFHIERLLSEKTVSG